MNAATVQTLGVPQLGFAVHGYPADVHAGVICGGCLFGADCTGAAFGCVCRCRSLPRRHRGAAFIGNPAPAVA